MFVVWLRVEKDTVNQPLRCSVVRLFMNATLCVRLCVLLVQHCHDANFDGKGAYFIDTRSLYPQNLDHNLDYSILQQFKVTIHRHGLEPILT